MTDKWNSRVMMISKQNKPIRIAGSDKQGYGNDRFVFPSSLIMDQIGTLYVADTVNNRIMCWFKGAPSGKVVVGGTEDGPQLDRLPYPYDLTFDRHGNLYVADFYNH